MKKVISTFTPLQSLMYAKLSKQGLGQYHENEANLAQTIPYNLYSVHKF